MLLVLAALLIAASVHALSISISGNPAKAVNASGVRIEWNTDEDATSRVDYGTTQSLGLVKEDLAFTRFHRVQIDGLQTNTKYYFQVTSIAQSGEFKVADNNGQMYSFTTQAGADTSPPGFQNVRATAFSDTSTTFQWTTTEAASTHVFYGEAAPYESTVDNARVVQHVATVPTTAGRLYTIIVGGCDNVDNCANASSIRFLAGSQTGAPPLTADIPSKVKQNRLDATGVTRPFSTITVQVNGFVQRTGTAEGNGTFRIPNVILTNPVQNSLKLLVEDAAGNKVEQTYSVTIDSSPPIVQLRGIPAVASASPLTISGNVSEPVTITYEVRQAFDTNPPARILVVSPKRVEENSVELVWGESPEPDIHEYAVYRNGIRIATSQLPAYTDSVSSGTNYQYRISAVDTSCNEGAQSDSLTVQTQSGGTTFTGEPTPVELTCLPEIQELQASGAFSFGVDLQDGNNQIKITVKDEAGNTVTFLNGTRLDSTAPQFLEDNLNRLSPTYIPEVTVKGKVSEQATVIVYVNNERKAFEVTDENGYFSIKVPLRRSAASVTNTSVSAGGSALPGTGNVVLDTGVGQFPNKVRIEAVDFAGLKTSKEATIVYALCGEGSWFKVDVGEIAPSTITPRLVIEGVQQLGFPVNISYRGGYKAIIKKVTVDHLRLSGEEEEDYDAGWVNINYLKNPRNPGDGYVQIAFIPQPVEEGQTTSEKEIEIAEHRKGEECRTPGVGCARFLLQLEVQAQEQIPKAFGDIRIDTTTGNVTVENLRQKVCLPIEVAMDIPISLSAKIPRKFLEQTSAFLASAIDLIDSILKPLTTVGTYTIYTCFAMNAWLFVKFVDEAFSCDVSQVAGAVGGTSWKKEVAEIGACDQVYPKDSKQAENDACNKCQSAILSRVNHEGTVRTICDRVACPSAPTLQTHIGDKQREGVRAVGVQDATTGENLFAGSSCGFTGKEIISSTTVSGGSFGFISLPDFTIPVKAQPIGYGYDGIKKTYLAHLENKKEQAEAAKVKTPVGGTPQKTKCGGLHPARPECCGTEYYEEWGSACGIPGLIETFDEIEQSACLAAQKANKMAEFEKEASQAKGTPVTCNSLFNSAAGFCEPDTGFQPSEVVPTGIYYPAGKSDAALSREVYVSIEPDPPQDPKQYKITRGFVLQRAVEQRLPPEKRQQAGNERFLNAKLDFASDGVDLTPYFGDVKGVQENTQIKGFAGALCQGLGPECSARATGVYNSIKGKIGIVDKTYIVRPDQDGILRSVQCVCLPAVVSYLEFWRNVMGVVKTCVDHIRLTGDGSAGVCKAALSTYACDLLYDILRCFIQKYSTGGAGARSSGTGIGDTLGKLTGAGSSMQRSVQGRYGQSALWQSMFSERKLLHSICAFAFTGQWDLNFESVFQQTVNAIPIESQGLIYPADRRYVTYSPLTKPKGLVTWVYHFGVGLIAGSDLNYQMKLKCSNSLRCEPRDGFRDGKCDCFGKTELTLPINPPELGTGRLKKNEVLNTEVFYIIQAGDLGSSVRFDTAIIEYDYQDAQGRTQAGKPIEAKIHLAGGDAPNFCRADLLGTPLFVCQIGIGDYAGAQFTKDPVLKSPPGNTLLTTKAADFGVSISLLGSADPRPQGSASAGSNTKYLVYDLRNQLGISVSTNKDNPVKVDTEGEREYTVTVPRIDEDMFTGTAAGGQAGIAGQLALRAPTETSPIDPINFAKQFVNPSPGVTGVSGLTAGQQLKLVLVFKGNSVDIYEYDSVPFDTYAEQTPERATTGTWGYYKKKQVPGGSASALATGVPITNNAIIFAGPFSHTQQFTASMSIGFLPNKIPPVKSEMLVQYAAAAAGTGQCAAYKTSPAKWSAKFTLYDSTRPQYGGLYGPNLEQPATDAEGNPQERTITVNAVCASEYVAAGGVPGTAGFPPGVNPCNADGSVANTNACWCGTAAEAQQEFTVLGAERFKYNCGPGNEVNPGKHYCGYVDETDALKVGIFATNRKCLSQPAPPLQNIVIVAEGTEQPVLPQGNVYALATARNDTGKPDYKITIATAQGTNVSFRVNTPSRREDNYYSPGWYSSNPIRWSGVSSTTDGSVHTFHGFNHFITSENITLQVLLQSANDPSLLNAKTYTIHPIPAGG